MAVNETVGINLVADTKSLRSQLREATQELAKLQNSATASAEEIRKAAKRAGELKDRIGDAKATIDAFNPDAKFRAFGSVVTGVAGAFTAVQGALALVGVESEDVQKTLLKVQGALALSQGLNQVLELKDAFTNLKIQVLGSTVAIAANNAVTTIASRLMKLFGLEVIATSTTFKVLKTAIASTGIGVLVVALGAAVVAFQSYTSSANDAVDAQERLNKSIDESNETQRKVESDFISDRAKKLIAEAKIRGASAKEIFKIEDQARTSDINSQKRLIAEKQKLNFASAESELQLKKLEREREIARLEFQASQAEKARQRNSQARDEARRQSEQDAKAFEEEQHRKYLAYEENEKKIYEDRIKEVKRAASIIEQLEKRGEQNQKLRLERIGKRIEDSGKKEIEFTVVTQETKLAIISDAVGAAANLIGRNTVAGKALAIAQATIDTYAGATKAFAAYPPPFGAIAAATVVANGLANVRQIVQTEVPTFDGAGGGFSTPSISTQAPVQQQYMPTAPTSLDQKSLNTINNVVARAYVVESDITGKQKRIKRIENAARI
jgi:hypothetical protein